MLGMNNSLAHFKSRLSDSFFSKIGILDSVIGDRHWLTTGTFKERVLISYLRDVLPKSLTVKSGFVTFPVEKKFQTKIPDSYDALNSSSFILSRQVDNIIYDTLNPPTVYEDDDIAIVLPEAVRGIVEVKGMLDHKHLKEATESLIDFGLKWKDYKDFRKSFYLDGDLVVPGLYQYFWSIKQDKHNKRKITPAGHREKIAKMVKKAFLPNDLDDVPMIRQSSLYSEYSVHGTHYSHDSGKCDYSYVTDRGQYVIFDPEGTPQHAGDNTLASVARDVLCTSNMLTNRLLIDPDETGVVDILPKEDNGVSVVFENI